MRIAIFGATGPTGKYIIDETIKQGHSLTAYTRDAAKLRAYEGKLDMVAGDLKNIDAIKKCIQGSNAVISALGPNSIKIKEKRPVMDGVKNILSVMDQLGVKRFIQVSTSASPDPKDSFDLKTRASLGLIKLIAFNGYDDVKATGELVRTSNADWTLVRIPYLKDGPSNGRVKVGWYGQTKLRWSLFRGNLAKFLVDQASNPEFIRLAPAIANI